MKIELTVGNYYSLFSDNGKVLYRSLSLFNTACVQAFLAQKQTMSATEHTTATAAMKEYDKGFEAIREKNAQKSKRKAEARAAAAAAAMEQDLTKMDLTIPDPTDPTTEEKKGEN